MEKVGRVKRVYGTGKGLYFIWLGRRVYIHECMDNMVFASNGIVVTLEWEKDKDGDFGIQLYGTAH